MSVPAGIVMICFEIGGSSDGPQAATVRMARFVNI